MFPKTTVYIVFYEYCTFNTGCNMTTPDNFKEIKYPSMLTTYIKEPKMY